MAHKDEIFGNRREVSPSPSPLGGEGWGGGSGDVARPTPNRTTPTPNPSPRGGGEQTARVESVARAAAPGFVLERSEAVPALIGKHQDFLFIAGLGGTASDVGAVTGDSAHVYSLGVAM